MQNRSISILFMMFPCFTAKKAMKNIKKGQKFIKKFEKKRVPMPGIEPGVSL